MFNIYTATGVLMAATVLQMGLIYAIDRKLQAMHKITLVLILLFGTLTLVLQDDRFIRMETHGAVRRHGPGPGHRGLGHEEKHPANAAGQPTDPARRCLDAPEPGMDCLLRLHVGGQRLCGDELQHRILGRLQTVGLSSLSCSWWVKVFTSRPIKGDEPAR